VSGPKSPDGAPAHGMTTGKESQFSWATFVAAWIVGAMFVVGGCALAIPLVLLGAWSMKALLAVVLVLMITAHAASRAGGA
jgi:hypothetical protein